MDKQRVILVPQGQRKKLSELKVDSYFVFTNRKKMPCLYKGMSEWSKNPIWLWVEINDHGYWTVWGKDLWVIDYGDKFPMDLADKWNSSLERHRHG